MLGVKLKHDLVAIAGEINLLIKLYMSYHFWIKLLNEVIGGSFEQSDFRRICFSIMTYPDVCLLYTSPSPRD